MEQRWERRTQGRWETATGHITATTRGDDGRMDTRVSAAAGPGPQNTAAARFNRSQYWNT